MVTLMSLQTLNLSRSSNYSVASSIVGTKWGVFFVVESH